MIARTLPATVQLLDADRLGRRLPNPAGPPDWLELHHIEAAGTEIKVRAVNVERQPEDVLGQVDELAAEIALGTPIPAAV
jgi:hypothetical protein